MDDMLVRAKKRIIANGYFDPEKVERLMKAAEGLEDYFAGIKPVAYLDDISTKNLLIHEGKVTGVIDIDWMGAGDNLTYVAMTNMALLNMRYDTDYVTYLLEEMQLSEEERGRRLRFIRYCSVETLWESVGCGLWISRCR